MAQRPTLTPLQSELAINTGLDRLLNPHVDVAPFVPPTKSAAAPVISGAETEAKSAAAGALTAPITTPGFVPVERDNKDLRDIENAISFKAKAIRLGANVAEREQALTEYSELTRLKIAGSRQEVSNLAASVSGLTTRRDLQKKEGIFALGVAIKMNDLKKNAELDELKLDILQQMANKELGLDDAMLKIATKRVELLGDSQRLANDLEKIKIHYESNNIAEANMIINQTLRLVQTVSSVATSLVALSSTSSNGTPA